MANAISLSYVRSISVPFTPQSAAFSYNGILAVGGDYNVYFYDQSFSQINSAYVSGMIMGGSFGYGYFAFVTWDGSVYIFNTDGYLVSSFTASSVTGYTGWWDALMLDDDTVLLSGGAGIRGVDIYTQYGWSVSQEVPPHGVAVYHSGSDLYVYVADYDNDRVNIIDGYSGIQLGSISVNNPNIVAACGGYLAVATDNTLYMYSLSDPTQPRLIWYQSEFGVTDIAFSPDCQYVAILEGLSSTILKIRDSVNGNLEAYTSVGSDSSSSVAWWYDLIAVANQDGNVYIYRVDYYTPQIPVVTTTTTLTSILYRYITTTVTTTVYVTVYKYIPTTIYKTVTTTVYVTLPPVTVYVPSPTTVYINRTVYVPTTVYVPSPTTVYVNSTVYVPTTDIGITYIPPPPETVTVTKTVVVTSWATKTIYLTKTVTTTVTDRTTITLYPTVYSASTPILYFAPSSSIASWTLYKLQGGSTTALYYTATCVPYGIEGTLTGIDGNQHIDLGYIDMLNVYPQTVAIVSITPTSMLNVAPKIYCTNVIGKAVLLSPTVFTTSINGTITIPTLSFTTQTIIEPIGTTTTGAGGVTVFTTTYSSSTYVSAVTSYIVTLYEGITTLSSTLTSLISTFTQSLILLPVTSFNVPISFGGTIVLGDAFGAMKATYTLAAPLNSSTLLSSSSKIPIPALLALLSAMLLGARRRSK
ncbi:hypothetical protein IPA_01155 [Ignicoccus pacificus DSM 13166]|uniref:Uncharacterized protein n=1 Tax=Ignicoccus pacificus DSM 13166 TaxID=940294 RepID=A0A977KAG0_9CREN|nr:hypothetical protein IPA_01155 [Ignicoccus pacificus DSM 13166]